MAAGDLADPEKLKLMLGTGTGDAILQALITQASDYLASELRRTIAQDSFTERYHGRGQAILILRKWPIVSVASVLIDGVAIAASATPAASGWYQSGDREIALRGYVFTKGAGNVVVTYTSGYATVPARFERACLSTCMRWYRELDRIGQVSKVVGGENITFALGLPDDVKRLIERERDVVPA